MGNGKRSGLLGSTEKSASLERDVGLALKVQTSGSIPSKKMMAMSQPPPHPHPHPHHFASDDDEGMGAGADGGAGGPIYYNTSNRMPAITDIYDVVGAGGAVVVPTTWHPFASDSSLKTSAARGGGGGMPVPVGVPFTVSQWQELERQTMIYKYMMASIPVPPELLIAMARTPSNVPASQSNMSALDLRFSSGSDPEPWRCRRTDGKKWRCSRDVAPDQKYCERHAHKSRPRSRKPVELQPHTTTATTTTSISTADSGNTMRAHPLIHLPTNATTQLAFQNRTFDFPTLVPAATYDQPRCTEWFTKSDANRISILNHQWQQLMQSPSRVGLKRNSTDFLGKNASAFPLHYGEGKDPMNPNSCVNVGDGQRLQTQKLNDQYCSLHRQKFLSLPGNSYTEGTPTTRHFIDAWSSAEREEMNEISNRCSVSSNGKLPLSSLTLSMCDGNGIDEENDNAEMGLGLTCSEKESLGSFKSQWLNPVPWMGSQPGGPLGEALCLGITNPAKTTSNIPSPRGYSNSTTTGSGSKSS